MPKAPTARTLFIERMKRNPYPTTGPPGKEREAAKTLATAAAGGEDGGCVE